MALRPRVAEAMAAFEPPEQPPVAGSMPEAMMALQRRAVAAPARSVAEAGSRARQARRLAESEASAAQAAAVLPAAWDAAVVLLRAEAQARDVAEAPRQEAEAEARDVAAVPRPEEEAAARVVAAVLRPEAAAQAGVAEVARQPAARDAAGVLRRAARGAQALPSAAVFPPCRFRVLPPAP
jgi:hypothetical protein